MGRFGGEERAELDLGGGVDVLRLLPLDRDGGVWGLELEGVKDLKIVSRSLEYSHNTAHKESNLRISVCEYDAPMTMLGSAVFEETFLGFPGLLRQKGEVLLLEMVSWSLC